MFSSGELTRFKVYHGISNHDVSGEQMSADLPSAENFVEN